MHRSLWALTLLLAGCPDRSSPKVPEPAALQWVLLPGGSFTMGRDGGDRDESPVHHVRVPGFEITKTEVTLAQYRRCVDAGRCVPPGSGDRCNWGRAARRHHPVNCVDWAQARRFCRWAGGRLPTEAEWEYAARSGGRPWTYPWGDQRPSCERVIMPGCGEGGTVPVCSRPRGNSHQGLCDLAGNVWEWVADCWHGDYRGAPEDGSAWTSGCKGKGRMVVRGSSFLNGTPDDLRAASRDSSPAGQRYFSIGLRCARDAI